MVVVATPSVMASSTIGLDLVRAAALAQRRSTLFMSSVTGQDEVSSRMVAAEARIALKMVRSGVLDEAEQARAVAARDAVRTAPLVICGDTRGVDFGIAEIEATARRAKAEHGVELVVIDNPTLLAESGRDTEIKLDDISRRIKTVASRFSLAVVVTTQLALPPAARGETRPRMSDLGKAALVAEVADAVILVHLPAEVDPTSPRIGEAEFFVTKNRHGGMDNPASPFCTPTMAAGYQESYARFAVSR
jgi:replicative DNA helicase